MGNHTIDCEFCGADQRIEGEDCCAKSTAARKASEAAYVKRRVDALAVCERWGISTTGCCLSLFDVADALIKYEKKPPTPPGPCGCNHAPCRHDALWCDHCRERDRIAALTKERDDVLVQAARELLDGKVSEDGRTMSEHKCNHWRADGTCFDCGKCKACGTNVRALKFERDRLRGFATLVAASLISISASRPNEH